MVMSNLEMPRLKDRKRLPEKTPDSEVDRLVQYLPYACLTMGSHIP
jgi:hypothetical protein